MNNHKSTNNHKAYRLYNREIKPTEKQYSIEDVVEMIKTGEVGLSTEIIMGVHGAKYVRTPSNENIDTYNSEPSLFYLDDIPYTIPMVIVDGIEWFQLGPILSMLSLNNSESDIRAIELGIPFELKRMLTFRGHGYRRTYIRIEALELLGISTDKKTIVKKKVNLYYNDIMTFKINLPVLRERISDLMNKMPTIDDKIFMGDVYRILSQLE